MQTHVVEKLQMSHQNELWSYAGWCYLLSDFSAEILATETESTKNVRNFTKQEPLRALINFFSLSFTLVWGIWEFNFRFEKILSELESHVDERIASGSYDSLTRHLVPFVHKLLSPKEFPERLILTATAILDNNCFEISLQLRGIELGGLFLMSLILCHDCVPNTKHYVNFVDSNDIDIQRYQMTFQTTGEASKPWLVLFMSCSIVVVPVRKGEHLTTTYTNTLKTTLERRRHLKQTKIFDCDCRRCQDSSEFLTQVSSWVCQQCDGAIVSKNPLDNNSDWRCEDCKAEYSREVRKDRQIKIVIEFDSKEI